MKIKSLSPLVAQSLLAAAFITNSAFSAPNTLSPATAAEIASPAFACSGYIRGTNSPNISLRGTGTVVRNKKIVLTTASLESANGPAFFTGFEWVNAINDLNGTPSTNPTKQTLRGFWYWTSYTAAFGTNDGAVQRGSNDFAVHYAYEPLAASYAGWSYSDSTTAHPLNTTAWKLVIGYPVDSGYGYRMASVGPFTDVYRSVLSLNKSNSRFFWKDSLNIQDAFNLGMPYSMGGGGVFIYDSKYGWVLSGVSVPQPNPYGRRGWGSRPLDSAAYNLMSTAIQAAEPVGQTDGTIARTDRIAIPDNRTNQESTAVWVGHEFKYAGMPSRLVASTVTFRISHPSIQDLDIMVTSPTGRTALVQRAFNGGTLCKAMTNRDVTVSFAGTNPNGVWKVSVRDLIPGGSGTLDFSSLNISARN